VLLAVVLLLNAMVAAVHRWRERVAAAALPAQAGWAA